MYGTKQILKQHKTLVHFAWAEMRFHCHSQKPKALHILTYLEIMQSSYESMLYEFKIYQIIYSLRKMFWKKVCYFEIPKQLLKFNIHCCEILLFWSLIRAYE